tara:strand:- start:333 stop:845 length:513 start_codon:yes stop_codon:yes gene_type:complete
MPEVSKALTTTLKRANALVTFPEWCKEKKLLSPMDVALLARDEKAVDGKIPDACKDKVTDHKEHAIEVSIHKAWHFCRESLKHTAQEERRFFDLEEVNGLDAVWLRVGGYALTLSTKERVRKPLLKKLHAMVSSDPIEFDIVLFENITILAYASKMVVQLVKPQNDGVAL